MYFRTKPGALALQNHIGDLLYHYDCVIIPEFGGFVTNYKPASLNKRLHLFQPPSKEVSFNRSLVKNDGLLASHLAEWNNCTFEEANDKIRTEVEDYFTRLNNGERITFKKVGIVYRDTARQLRFQPSQEENFLKDAFGLEQLFAIPVMQPEKVPESTGLPQSAPVKKVPAPEPAEAPVVPITHAANLENDAAEAQESSGNRRARWIWAAAVVLPFLLYSGWLVSSADVLRPAHLTIADLNPFAPKDPPVYTAREHTFLWVDHSEDDALLELLDSEKEVVRIAFTDVSNEEGVAVRLRMPEPPPAPAVNTYVATPELLAMRYHVVGGCFAELSNAHKLVDRLRAKGYPAYLLDQHKGLYRVTFGNYARRQEALDALRDIKRDEMPAAWLLLR
ncbi:MAG: SPOR domain-containing protein [Cryomorphaceae bacterium]|nr:MAG: SPOR domain-containing protein [Cryomorphaceae bacterium]